MELSAEDIKFLVENTDFSEEEIQEWFREFLMDCPDGILTKIKVVEMLSKILPDENGAIVADVIFSTFDRDGSGWIDFNEFIIATYCSANVSLEEKLQLVFQLYDKVNFPFS